MTPFLTAFSEFIQTQPFRIIRLAEVRGDGEISTFEMTEANPCQDTYSVAKTFTMTAVGLLWDRGLLSLDEKLADLFRDEISPETEKKMDPRWNAVTVEHALTHRLGLPGGFLDIDVYDANDFGDDYLAYTLTYPLAYTPGEDARYSDGAFYLLSRAAAKKAGTTMDKFLWRELFYPLGFREMAWSACPKGHPMGATGLYIRAEDMVKLGQIYLSGGLYRGKRILSEEWTRMAMEKEFALDWDGEHRVCFKGGMFGQKLMIVPGQRRAAALQAYGADSNVVLNWVRAYGDRD